MEPIEVMPITEIGNFAQLAADYAALLTHPSNKDLLLDFPNTVARYGGESDEAVRRFELARQRCADVERHQFLIMVDGRAVGNASVDQPAEVPADVSAIYANASLFVCHPFRGRGLGGLALDTQLTVIRANYAGAWTTVRASNVASHGLIRSRGFKPIGAQPGRVEEEVIYMWQDTSRSL